MGKPRSRSKSLLGLALTLALGIGTLAGAPAAHAQGNDLSAPTGGRSALMGNTGVALASDGSGPFLNPATIVRIQDQRLAFSVNFYSLGLTHYTNWHQPGNVDPRYGGGNLAATGLTTNAFRVLPSSLCLFFDLHQIQQIVENGVPVEGETRKTSADPRRRKLAVCFASVESVDIDLQALHVQNATELGTTVQSQAFSQRWSRTYVGPTYSTYVSPKVSLGASAQVVYTYDAFGIHGNSITSNMTGADASSISASGTGHAFDLTASIGTMVKHGSYVFGASVRAPSLHLFGKYDGTFGQTNAGSSGDIATLATGTGRFYAPGPMRLAVGGGYESAKMTLEVDAAMDLSVMHAVSTSLFVSTNQLAGGVTTTHSQEYDVVAGRVTVSPSIGTEYFLSNGFSLLGGLSANFTSIPPLTPSSSVGNIVQARTNHVIGAFGFGSYNNGKQLLFGAQFDYGWGQTLAVDSYAVPNQFEVVNTQSYNAMLIIAGATDLPSIVRAAKRVEETMTTGNPHDGNREPPPRDAPPVAFPPASAPPAPPHESPPAPSSPPPAQPKP